ncbi:hypothetical protein HPP92_008429 [Vanilla planifolia]|uniref:RING-type E3 ubiquitin transferase n=1 Tax=Vanilla planifolia TaxID=51239 RepID=A0A835RAF0_VANPL|nr:hypothetical protein HPP92_008429 [Vanilla planifolia]
MSLPTVAIVATVGIAATAVFLLSYSVFVLKCCLNCRPSDLLLRLFSLSSSDHPSSSSPTSARTSSSGLQPSVIRAIPTVRFSSSSSSSVVSTADCAVCQDDFRNGDMLRLLPGCTHAFHIDCVDPWLDSSASCPICRADISVNSIDAHLPRCGSQSRDAVVIDTKIDRVAPRSPPRGTSKGDECIEDTRDVNGVFADAQSSGDGRFRRSFFSLGHDQSARTAQPNTTDVS